MKVLLDTHVVLWTLSGRRALSEQAQEAIRAADDLLVSAVTFAEVGVKASVGKLRVPAGFRDAVESAGARVLGLTPEHGLAVAALPLHHKDPFDRLLIAQAQVEDLTIVTAGESVLQYDVAAIRA